jgi:hypothetical protein
VGVPSGRRLSPRAAKNILLGGGRWINWDNTDRLAANRMGIFAFWNPVSGRRLPDHQEPCTGYGVGGVWEYRFFDAGQSGHCGTRLNREHLGRAARHELLVLLLHRRQTLFDPITGHFFETMPKSRA